LASCGGIVRVLGGRRQTLDSGTAPVANPQFAAERIFNIKSAEPLPVVRELGFANASTGILGICAFFNSGWVMPAAIVGGLFCGLAGVGHAFKEGRNLFENVAMYSDLFVFIMLLVYVVATVMNW
jgi:hypothetical protein